MKALLFSYLMFSAFWGFSQISSEDSTAIEEDGVVQEWVNCDPEYPGGYMAMMRFVMDSTKYPPKAAELGIQGAVYVEFVVDTIGALTEIKVIHGHDLLRKPAVDMIRAMPNWIPACCNGKCHKVRYTVPVQFKLG